MPRFNHQTALSFTVISDTPDGSDWTPELLREAVLRRIHDLDKHNEWLAAVGPPIDTYEED